MMICTYQDGHWKDRQMDRQTDIHTDRQRERKTDRQTDWQQTDRQTTNSRYTEGQKRLADRKPESLREGLQTDCMESRRKKQYEIGIRYAQLKV